LRSRLCVDLEEVLEPNEPLLVSASNQDIEVVHCGLDRDSLLHREIVVDDELVLGVVRCKEGEESCELLALAQVVHELLIDSIELLIVGAVCLIEQAQSKSARRSVAGDRWWLEELHDRPEI